jgi:rubrerythrin
MKINLYKLSLIALMVISLSFLGCSSSKVDNKSEPSHAAKQDQGDHAGHDHEKKNTMSGHTNMGGTMEAALTAENLYECPMCAGVVSADAETPCPICKMKLVPMDAKKTADLRASHPKGCPMDAIVFEGDSKTEMCPVCKMKLRKIGDEHSEGNMKRGSIQPGVDDSACKGCA